MYAAAHGYYGGEAALGGFVGGIVGGLIASGIAPYPVYVAPAPVIVEPYAPAPLVVTPYRPPMLYYGGGVGGWHGHGWHDRGWRGYGGQGHRWHDGDRVRPRPPDPSGWTSALHIRRAAARRRLPERGLARISHAKAIRSPNL